MNRKHTPSIERLRELFVYSPQSGVLLRKIRRGSAPEGAVAGGDNSHGYLVVPVDGRRYMAHCIAWAMHYGQWPTQMLDHIDRNRANNAIANLRVANNELNQGNTKINKRNTSGYRGVSWCSQSGKWTAFIRLNGRNKRLGSFETRLLAAEAYSNVAKQKFGEFYA